MREPVELLIEKYQKNLFVAAFNICKNTEDANDIVQDTFIQYHTSNKQFHDGQHIRAWLIRVSVNRAKDITRSFWHKNKVPLDEYIDNIPFENREERERRRFRSISVAAAVIAAVISLGTCVYAAGKYFGILDFSGDLRENFPSEAENLIDKEVTQTITDITNQTIMNCEIKEALCDSEIITIVYEVSAKESGKYLFIPEDALPGDFMSDWGGSEEITALEYAEKQGLELVNVGGGIVNTDELGIEESSVNFRSADDDVMDIYIRSEKSDESKNMNVICVATARLSKEEEMSSIMRKNMQFTLENMADAECITYIVIDETALVGAAFKVQTAEVIQTDLGTYMDVIYTEEKETDPSTVLCFRLLDADGSAYETVGMADKEKRTDGTYKQRIILNKMQNDEIITLEAYDCYGKTVYGQLKLMKE